ncbi:MAG: glycosyl transferase family 1 [Candidatus Syntrophoarchaeum caldarius]|uniref:Glycosyl transferase family 1 n=1 Tax=Candidatus Syntropharchaeum caldarium TaxID=1838285 RepID=A0A1F2P8X9_9EURY|nr:MAG: glycosyl transferase family 1 [Candidatus Syntrophoarchaeum caldarius]
MLTYLGEESGVYTHAKNIATQITKSPDVDLHIISIGDENIITNQFGATIHFIKRANFRGATYFYYPLLFKKKIIEINPDIVHIQGYARYYYIAVSLLKRYPFILTLHSNLTEELEYRLPQSLKRYVSLKTEPYLEKRLVRKAEQVIVPSPHMVEFHVDMKDKMCVIPNGVAVEKIQNSVLMQRDMAHPSILFVGRLEKIKGVDILIKSISFVVSSIPNVHLYIAGIGEEEGELKHLVKKLDIEENVTFLGFVSEDDKWSYYKSTDLCVVPSLEEPFGIVLLEAMACGKPVVASNVGGIPYIVEDGETGLLFECGNIEDLAERVTALLEDKELRKKMGEAGYEKAKEFSWSNIADRTLELYRVVLSEVQVK